MTRKILPTEDVLEKMEHLLSITADYTRLKILCALLDGPKYVGELQDIVDASQSLISHQLKVLKDASLVKNEREGNHVSYSLSDDHVASLLSVVFDHASE